MLKNNISFLKSNLRKKNNSGVVTKLVKLVTQTMNLTGFNKFFSLNLYPT
jgi:hypothetical protein